MTDKNEDQERADRERAERENAQRDEAARNDQADQKERRPTVIVTCSVPNGVVIRRHTPGLEDRAPVMPTGQGYELKQGDTEGVDKEWFEGWLEENRGMSLVTGGQISWRDAPEPTEEELAAEEDQRRREKEETDRIAAETAAGGPGRSPVNQQAGGTGIKDGPGNPATNQPKPQPEASTLGEDPGKSGQVQDPRVQREQNNFTDLTDTDRRANPNNTPDADAHKDRGTVDNDKGDADDIDEANRKDPNRPTAGV